MEDEGRGTEKQQHTEVFVAAVTAGLFEIGNDCFPCSGLVVTACLIPLPSPKETVG